MQRSIVFIIFMMASFIILSGNTLHAITVILSQNPTARSDKHNTPVNLALKKEIGPAFSVNRIELYFENRRPDITVKRNEPINALVDIKYTGSGLLQGYWEVDGRILSHVNQHLISGNSITLQSPKTPMIPTFDTGTHIVKFVITSPASTVPLPSVLFFVVPTDYAGKPVVIKLVSPKRKSMLEYAPVKFEWEKFDSKASYSIQFFKGPKEKPVFSICLFETSYTVPESALKRIFIPGEKYYWRIIGCCTENNLGESQLREFTFKK